jgi:lactate dehydrogenase-like 2-hydroxyacid dehydrogenase
VTADVLMTAPLEPALMAGLDAAFTTHRLWEGKNRAAFLAGIGPRIRGVVTRSAIGIDKPLMDALPKLEIVSIFGVGADKVDLEAARARGIRVTNTPDVQTEDTADYGIGLLLALARKIVVGDRYVREGHWKKALLPNSTRVHGKRLGIVGLGRIGAAVARRAEGFAMDISYAGPRAKPGVPYRYFADARAMAAHADFIILTCPGGPETANLVDAAFLKALGSEGMLVNIARASIVDENALVAALAAGTIKAAALDVFPDEPNVSEALLALPNLVVEPHIASTTVETRQAIGDLVLDNVKAYFAGRGPLTPLV